MSAQAEQVNPRMITCGHWQGLAACRSADPELFFPPSAAGPSLKQAEQAKAICACCPVRRQCLAFAMLAGQTHGIWGGLTEDERRAVTLRAAVARYASSAAGPRSSEVSRHPVPRSGGKGEAT